MMLKPTIHGTGPAFSASEMLEKVGERIGDIRKARKMTWGDVGAAFGKSDDVAANYAAGLSDMPLSSFVRGVAAFGPQLGDVAIAFAGFRLCSLEAPAIPDRALPRPLTELTLKLMRATEDGTDISDDELRDAGQEILDAGHIIDALRERLAVLGIGGDA